jgi:RimJ/RimL family protein N-acetyltransferase
MAFGHWMEIKEGEVHLRLGPIRRDEIVRFVAADARHGIQSYEVGRFLGGSMPPSEEGEQEWWDANSKDRDKVHWGVYVPVDAEDGAAPSWKLIGNTSLFLRGDRRQAESGFVVFDRAYWRQRIASTAHLGRTQYAFRELDLLAITSCANAPNVGSNRALQGVGYVQTGTTYGDGVVGGRPIDTNLYLMPNPAEEAWRYFWRRPEEEIPEVFREARARTQATLDRADTAVTFL